MFYQFLAVLLFFMLIVVATRDTRIPSLHNPHFFVILHFFLYGIIQYYVLLDADGGYQIEFYNANDIKSIVIEGVFYFICCFFVYILTSSFLQVDRTGFDSRKNFSTCIDERKLSFVGWGVFSVSVISSLVYIGLADRDIVESIFNPQKIYFENDGASSAYTSNGYLLTIATLSGVYSYIFYGYFLFYDLSMAKKDKFLYFCLVFSFVFFAAVTSNRGMIVGFAMTFFIIKSAVGKKIDFVKFGLSVFVFFLLFIFLTASRSELDFFEAFEVFISTVALYNGGAGVINTAMIQQFFEPSYFYWGETFLWLLAFPVPRALWPDKPLTALDEVVARHVYGYSDAAFHTTPPGIFGELYMNFGFVGSLLMLAGFIYCWLYLSNFYKKKAYSGNFVYFVFYCVFLSRLFYFSLSSSINTAMINVFVSVFEIIIFVFFVKSKMVGFKGLFKS